MQNGLPATCQAMQLKAGETAKFPKIDETFKTGKGLVQSIYQFHRIVIMALCHIFNWQHFFSSSVVHKIIVLLTTSTILDSKNRDI